MDRVEALGKLIDYWRFRTADPLQREVLERLYLYRSRIAPPWPGQNLVLIGPTQSGKSTMVNALLDVEAATPSAKAGFTRSIYGFSSQHFDWPAGIADQVKVLAQSHALEPWVVWDTPDFDSIHADEYFEPLCAAIGQADLVLLLVSQEKYGDAAVWKWARYLQGLGLAWRLVLNKIDHAHASVLIDAAGAYLQDVGHLAPALALPSFKLHADRWDEAVNALSATIAQQDLTQAAVDANFSELALLPLQEQSRLSAHWQQALKQQNQRLQQEIEVELSSEARPAVLDQAMLRVMQLTELPWLDSTLGRLRRLISAPINWLRRDQKTAANVSQFKDLENRVWLMAMATAAELGGDESQRMLGRLRQSEAQWRIDASVIIDAAQVEMDAEVEVSAQALYQVISQQPVVLNSLRTLRVSLDVGAVLLTVKTFGVGTLELLMAPAILAVTNTLTESAVSVYVDREAARLGQKNKERQQLIVEALFAKQMSWRDEMELPLLHQASREAVLAVML